MLKLTVSLSGNVLKISTIESNEFKGVSAEVSPNVVSGHTIINADEFSVILVDLIASITKKSLKSISLDFLIEPQDVVLKFVTVNKRDGAIDEQIISEIKNKLKDVNLEELYFSYLKIAPFVYQFVGVKKSVAETYLNVASGIGVSVNGLVPWITLLPKFIGENNPVIFISKLEDKQVVVLSEFGGVFFTGVYENEQTTEDLQKLVEELSVYKRTEPISKVYVYNCDSFSLNPGYEIMDIDIPNSKSPEAKGYEFHLLVDYMESQDPSFSGSQLNLLTLLKVPAVRSKKNVALVAVGSFLVVVLALGSIFVLANKIKHNSDDGTNTDNQVLSNQVQETEIPIEEPSSEEEEVEVQLNKSDLKIRVENGAGIAGIAGKTQTYLEEKGYTVVGVGNAAEIGYINTALRFKNAKVDFEQMVRADMSEQFTLEVKENLPDDSEYDLLIIVGTDAKL